MLCFRCEQIGKIVSESVPNQGQMLLGVTSELQGEPLVPKMTKCINVGFLAFSFRVFCGTVSDADPGKPAQVCFLRPSPERCFVGSWIQLVNNCGTLCSDSFLECSV